jgi:hypothetical protein
MTIGFKSDLMWESYLVSQMQIPISKAGVKVLCSSVSKFFKILCMQAECYFIPSNFEIVFTVHMPSSSCSHISRCYLVDLWLSIAYQNVGNALCQLDK